VEVKSLNKYLGIIKNQIQNPVAAGAGSRVLYLIAPTYLMQGDRVTARFRLYQPDYKLTARKLTTIT
jgi:hypothetical protein